MTVVTLTASQYADMLRNFNCVQVPTAIGGYLYMVVRAPGDENIYRVSIA
jgi:hypothetical protein